MTFDLEQDAVHLIHENHGLEDLGKVSVVEGESGIEEIAI